MTRRTFKPTLKRKKCFFIFCLAKMSAPPNLKLALVVDLTDSYDAFQVVDLISVQPLAPNTYIIQTKPFDDTTLKHGAGAPISQQDIQSLLKKSFK